MSASPLRLSFPPLPQPVDDVQENLSSALADRYAVERKLGAGGMATVFLARDVKHDRSVAIKVLHPELAATLGADRFEREIRVAGKLQHPNILGMYDSGNANGLLYYVMPFVEGESVRDRLDRESQLPVEDAVQIALEVADALGYAHAKGIVHRDIKPDNIMLSGGHALVADFGIARAIEEGGPGGAGKLTVTGMSLGTPVYMAPEQSAGEKVTPTADLYSLGCVLYEMLAGEPPFSGKNGAQIMAKHALEAVPSVRIVRPNVPEQVEQAIFAAMAKVPSDRPQTAAEFMEILGVPMGATSTRRAVMRVTSAYPAAGTVNLQGVTSQFQAAPVPVPFWRRPAAIASTLVVLALGAFGTWKIFGSPRASAESLAAGGLDPATVGVLYFDDQSRDSSLRYVADGLTDGLISTLSQVQGLSVISRTGVEQFRGTTLGLDSIARTLRSGTLVRGSVEPAGSDLRVNVSLVDGSGADFERRSFTLPAADITKVRDSLTAQVAELIRLKVGGEVRLKEQRAGTSNAQAWSLVQRAEQRHRQGERAAGSGDLAGMDSAFLAADSLLRVAEQADARWIEPSLARANLFYRRTRLIRRDPIAIKPLIDSGLAITEHALTLDAENADALELRGNLRYWGLLVGIEPDDAKAEALLLGAKADFEKATTLNPRQAGAWASLSHLYYRTSTGVDVNLAARRALEADAFLGNANVILDRLFLSSWDLEQFTDAERWCNESRRRFPGRIESVKCQLQLLATRAKDPDTTKARILGDSMVAVTAEQRRPLQRLHANMWNAAVFARAKQPAQARSLVTSSIGNAEVDPTRDLAFTGAFVYTLLGDKDAAIDLLKLYLSANPGRRRAFADDAGWLFRPLQDTPAFRQLVGGS